VKSLSALGSAAASIGAATVVGIEVYSLVRDLKKAKDQHREGKIYLKECIKIILERGCRTGITIAGAIAAGTIAAGPIVAGTIAAGTIAIPIVGTLIGSTLGSIIGRYVGTVAERFVERTIAAKVPH